MRDFRKRKTLEARAKEKRNKVAKEKDNGKAAELAREAADIEAELPYISLSRSVRIQTRSARYRRDSSGCQPVVHQSRPTEWLPFSRSESS